MQNFNSEEEGTINDNESNLLGFYKIKEYNNKIKDYIKIFRHIKGNISLYISKIVPGSLSVTYHCMLLLNGDICTFIFLN